MDDALTLSRSQHQESQAARMVFSTTGLYGTFIRSGGSSGVLGGVRRSWGILGGVRIS